jgi:hypothetical protein
MQQIAPCAQRLLTAGRSAPETATILESWLAEQLHWERIPVAALEAGGLGVAGDFWLRADPVHLRLDQRSARLMEATELELTASQARALWVTCAGVIAAHGGELQQLQPLCWAARFAHAAWQDGLLSQLSSLRQVRGKAISDYLPSGKPGQVWRKLSSELQIALHDHPVNRNREALGLPAVNSLWLWGDGVMPASQLGTAGKALLPWELLGTDITWLAALARQTGITVRSAGSGFGGLAKKSNALLVLEALEAPLAYADQAGLMTVLAEYEQLWFAPVWSALRRGAVRRVTLHPLSGAAYDLRRWHCWLSQLRKVVS